MSRRSRGLVAAFERWTTAAGRAVGRLASWASSPRPAIGLLVILIAGSFVIGEMGIDFGGHWDEWYHTTGIADCLNRLSPMPKEVSYGGPYFTLGFPVILVDEWRHLVDFVSEIGKQPLDKALTVYPSVLRFQAAALALVSTSGYVLQVRSVFLALTTLSALWMFVSVLRAWPRRTGAALAAAAFMALSWELGYHARWLAIDSVIAQVAALELFLFIGTWRASTSERAVGWYCATAAAAGAVFACKITGLFAMLPVGLTALLLPRPWRVWKRLALALLGGVTFLVTAFLLSPEFFLQPLQFLYVFTGGTAVYNSVPPTYSYYVTPTEHVWRTLLWFAGAVASPFRPVAFAFTAIALLGLANLLRGRDRRMTLIWLTFPAALVFVFSRNRMMVVRQFLMCMPIMALCFARGSMVAWDFLRRQKRVWGGAFAAAVVGGMVANAIFEAARATEVTHDPPEHVTLSAAADLLRNREGVRMSQPVFERLRPHLGGAYTCHPAVPSDKKVKHLVAAWAEYPWMSNRLGYFRHVYGAPEVNADYYATLPGHSITYRLMDISIASANELVPNPPAPTNLDCFPTAEAATRPPQPAPGPGGRSAT